MKKALEKLIRSAVAAEFDEEIASKAVFSVEYPPKPEMGDYATNVAMVLAKQVGSGPKEIAERLVSRMSNSQFLISNENVKSVIESIEVLGGFINFRIDAARWFKEVLEEVAHQHADYGKVAAETPEKILVEYLSPNTNKPLHLGHLRNGVTGMATINALKAQGHHVTKVGIINDRGVHICKAMLAYQRWGEGATPESTGKKPDHFVGDWYVRFSQEAEKNPALNDEAQDMLRKWEAGDAEVKKLWETIRNWVLQGWKETETLLGFSYDKPYFESDVYQLGKDIVADGLAKGTFRKIDKGNAVFDLVTEEFGLDEQGEQRMLTLLRADGTSLYTTQDLGLAVQRASELHIDRMVYVVGSEQRFHFQSLFAILKALGYGWAQKLYHLWYGMVYLPDGKMKSREGTVVDVDDLVGQMIELAKSEIDERSNRTDTTNKSNTIKADEREHRARIIALGAIKFYLLKQKPTVDIHFNPKESISFEGFTGPYCQYAYARGRSILRSAEISNQQSEIRYELLGDAEERQLLQKLESFPQVLTRAAEEYNPALVAIHVFETAQAFNSFYTSHPVLKAESQELQAARLGLVIASCQVIQNGLAVLGIETLEEM